MNSYTGSRSEFINVRGLNYHVRRWGNPEAPTVVLLHGWMDISATFQFLVDAFQHDWNLIAPDWAGYGLSEHCRHGYSFMQYCADLDALLDHYSPKAPVYLIAHSMGGNISGLYAGARPERIAKWVNMEGYAPIPGWAGDLGPFFARWLDVQRAPPSQLVYANKAEFAARLKRSNRRLTDVQASFLADEFCRELPDGQAEARVDPRARTSVAIPPHKEQIKAFWSNITADSLCITGTRSFIPPLFEGLEHELSERIGSLRYGREVQLKGASHNMHHDMPVELAGLIEPFLLAPPSART